MVGWEALVVLVPVLSVTLVSSWMIPDAATAQPLSESVAQITTLEPFEKVGGLKHNHRLFDSLVIVCQKEELSTGVAVIHEVEL